MPRHDQVSIDVLTPSLNYGRFLGEALDSVERQTSTGTHIVMDGESHDNTPGLLRSRARPGLVWTSERDHGQSDALNKALQLAESDWVGWLNADEFYLPDALATASELLHRRGDDVDVLYGDCAFVDVHGRLLRLLPAHRFDVSVLQDYGCFIPSCATFVRREYLLRHGWSPEFRHAMDWHLWLRFSAAGARFSYEPHVFACFRIHDQQVTARPENLDPAEFARLAVLRRQPEDRAARLLRQAGGRLAHIRRKAAEGAYVRQARAHRLQGRDVRWWQGSRQARDGTQLAAL